MSYKRFELHISRTKDEYFFLLNDPSQHTSLFREKISIPHAVRSMVLRKLDGLLSKLGLIRGAEQPQDLEEVNTAQMMTEFGSLIFKYMIPLNLREYLHRASAEDMVLSTDDVEIPWELLHDGEGFLCVKHSLGRKVQTRTPFREFKRPETKMLTALFIADPTKDLPDAKKEVNAIVEKISNLGLMDVDYLNQEEATVYNVLEKLEARVYDIFHYAGHVEFNASNPEESILRLHDDSIMAEYLFQIMDTPPKFAFMNACSSAKTAGIEYLETQGKLTGMASAFLSAGVGAYIGTLWPVHDEVASEFSIDFYKRILNGESIGLALKNAKKDIFDKYGGYTNTWASFILYGEPGLVLFEPESEETIQGLTKMKFEERTSRLEELFTRKIEFHDQVGEVFQNVRRAFRGAKTCLNDQINLKVEAQGIPILKEKEEDFIRKRVRIRDFTLYISGDKKSAAEFIKQLAKIHVSWYAGYEKVTDPVEHFLKVNEKYDPTNWWKVPGLIESMDDIVKCKIPELSSKEEVRILVRGAGLDGEISPMEYRNLIVQAKQKGIKEAEHFIQKIAAEYGIIVKKGDD
ncbi:MAG: CHAT domain-containing protein [Deltaproteobacteria bacterium]|nr:CHAT domain-containing protein [Deltaproteobacteria bacterium]